MGAGGQAADGVNGMPPKIAIRKVKEEVGINLLLSNYVLRE